MSTAQNASSLQEAGSMAYVVKSIAVDGLPPRAFYKSDGKYFLRVLVDEGVVWESRAVQTKASTVVWDEERDQHSLDCSPTSVLRVELCKRHTSRPLEEVGSVERAVQSWLDAPKPYPLVLSSNQKIKAYIVITVKLEPGDLPSTPDPIQGAVNSAESAAIAMRDLPGLSAVQGGANVVQKLKDPATEIASIWEPLLQNVDWFMNVMDVVTEVHPYAKTAWTVLSAAYKVVRAQQVRDARIMELLDVMKDTYEFIRQARQLDDIKNRPGANTLRETALTRLSTQTIECAHFISTYAKDRQFLKRILKQSTTGSSDAIDKYIESFRKCQEAFDKGSRLGMELVTFRMLGKLETIDAKLDVRQIPYVAGATYDSAKACLPGTRVALLEELTAWANSDDPAAPTVCFLMGPAGTGKSAIAHTLASRFDKTNQLGSMFCFSTSERATRTPASVFRNMAHDLCKGRPAFRDSLVRNIGDDMGACGTNDLEAQLEKFILGPAQDVELSGTILLVIEALDESGTERDRAKLLSLLWKQLPQLPAGFRVLVTCRPEPDILRTLTPPPPSVTRSQMPSIKEETSLAEDLKLYVRHQLSGGSGRLPFGLDDNACQQLVCRAEGLFQWAFVACDYINGESTFAESEQQRCRSLLQGERGSGGLDSLYKTVLEERFRKNQDAAAAFKMTLGMLLMAIEPLTMHSLREFMCRLPQELLPSAGIDMDTILPRLAALLSGVTQEDEPVRPLHTSFREFLCIEERGGDFYVGPDLHDERLLISCVTLLRDRLHFNMGRIPTSYLSNGEHLATVDSTDLFQQDIIYACKYWGNHLSRCMSDLRQRSLIRELVEHLLKKNVLYWMEVGSLVGATGDLDACLFAAVESLQMLDDDLRNIAWEATRFIRLFGPVLAVSAAHLYLSALSWCPSTSALSILYRSSQRNIPIISAGRVECWPMSQLSLTGHTDWVTSVAFSPNGSRVVSGSQDRTVRLWNATTGDAIGEPITGHTSVVTSVAFSPDGSRVVSGSQDRTVRVWTVATGDAIGGPITGHTDWVTSVAFSPDGTRVVSGSQDRTVRVWAVATGDAIGGPITGHTDWVTSVAFSPDGTRVISGSHDSTVRVWNATTGDAISEPITGHTSVVTSVAFSPDGTRVVSGSNDNTVRVWNVTTGDAIGEPITGHTDYVTSVAFSRDGTRVVSGSDDRTVRVWNATTGDAIGGPITSHTDYVNSVAFSPDGTRVVSGSHDRTVRVWNATTGDAVVEPITGHTDWVTSVALSPDGTRVVSGSHDSTVRVWNVTTGYPIGEPMTGHMEYVTSVAFSPDGTRVVSGSQDRTARVWNATTGDAIGEPITGHTDYVNSVAFSPDGTHVVSASDDQTVRVWNVSTGDAIGEPITGHTDYVNSVAFSPDGTRVVSGAHDSTVRVWTVATGDAIGGPITGHTDWVTSVAFSPDSTRIVSGSGDNTVRVWNVTTGDAIGEPMIGHTEYVTSVAFSPDGTRIVSGSNDCTVRVWSATTGEAIGEPITGHTRPVTSVAFSPDGTRVVSSSWDRTVRMWNATTGDAIGEPNTDHTRAATSVSFSPDGNHIVCGSEDRTVRVWNAIKGKAVGELIDGHQTAVASLMLSSSGAPIVAHSGDRDGRGAVAGAGDHQTLPKRLRAQDYPASGAECSMFGTEGVGPRPSEGSHVKDFMIGIEAGERLPGFNADGIIAHGARVSVPEDGFRSESVSSAADELEGDETNSVISGSEGDPVDIISMPYLSLSPHPEHQMQQPYTGRDPTKRSRITLNPRTGWIMGDGKDHLLWVPPDLIPRLCLARMELVIPGPMVEVDLSRFRHGTRWTELLDPSGADT